MIWDFRKFVVFAFSFPYVKNMASKSKIGAGQSEETCILCRFLTACICSFVRVARVVGAVGLELLFLFFVGDFFFSFLGLLINIEQVCLFFVIRGQIADLLITLG